MKHEIADIKLNKLSAKHLEQYIQDKKTQKKPLQPASISRELNLMGSVFSTCVKKWLWMAKNPMINVEKPKKPPARDRRISNEEINLILQELNYDEEKQIIERSQQTAVAFLLAIETAMRAGEIWGLQWEHVHLNEGYVFLPDTKMVRHGK